MRRTLTTAATVLLLGGLVACGPAEPPVQETDPPATEQETTEMSPPVEVSDGGGDEGEVVQPTETTDYEDQGEGTGKE